MKLITNALTVEMGRGRLAADDDERKARYTTARTNRPAALSHRPPKSWQSGKPKWDCECMLC